MGKLLGWLFVAGKLGKVTATAGTMLISIVGYGMVFGWRYAVGFVMLIFLHEMGHYVAARVSANQGGNLGTSQPPAGLLRRAYRDTGELRNAFLGLVAFLAMMSFEVHGMGCWSMCHAKGSYRLKRSTELLVYLIVDLRI